MPHAEQRIFMPEKGYQEDYAILASLFCRVATLPGRVAVLMDNYEDTFSGTSILVPGGSHTGKFRPDAGTVVSSGVGDLLPGDRVIVKPYDGLWCTPKEFSWVPDGREVRFYGIADLWSNSVLAKIEE